MYTNEKETGSQPMLSTHWVRRMGLAGFAFFFLKGRLWLIVPWLAHSLLG